MVNIARKELASHAQKPQRRANRSTTHIRIKKDTKFQLEEYAKKHHCRTFSEAIKKLLERGELNAN